jgi:hypothetical protein
MMTLSLDQQRRAWEFLDAFKAASDIETWLIAVLMVGLAGRRAAIASDDAIEKACLDFVNAMHDASGGRTPEGPADRTSYFEAKGVQA